MAADDDLSDDHVARLLAKDAKASSSRYTSYGLRDILPKRYEVSCLAQRKR